MMRAFSLAEARVRLQASVAGAPADLELIKFDAVSTDTRSVGAGQLFVALRGERFDGHQFLAQAQAQGAVAVVVDTVDAGINIPQLVVPDTVNALAQLAAANRDESAAQFVAITGSSGKTTVRQMTSAILAGMDSTLTTEGNLNNHIGVPLTLFRLLPEHRFGAIELGASGLGEIAHTVALVRPAVAILTNAGEAHLEGFGSYQNIVTAKGEIIEGVSENGVVVLNRDDPAFDEWYERAGQRQVLSVSGSGRPDADYRAIASKTAVEGFDVQVHGPDDWQCQLHIPLPGEHNIANGLMALAACRALGATDQQIVDGLLGVQTVKGRLQVLKPSAEITLIDDSYNANPSSMKAAIDVLAGYPGRRAAVFGAMAELGVDAETLHRDVGAYARARGIERLLVVGANSEAYASGFGAGAEIFQSHDQAVDAIVDGNQGAITVLVKGSRSSAMDRVVEGIQTKVNKTCCSG